MSAISIVIPLYNKGPYIARALNSVFTQTFQDFEVIVVDDGSTDDGPAVVRGFDDPRIRMIQQENQGVSAARNRGIEAARAELVAFLDADDEWLPGQLKTIMQMRKKYPGAGLYATAYFTCTVPEKLKLRDPVEVSPPPWEGEMPSYFIAAALHDMLISTSCVGVPKNVLRDIGGFRTGLNMYEDSELWGRIALRYPVAFSRQRGSVYHLAGENRLCHEVVDFEHPFIRIAEDAIREGQVPAEMFDDLQEYIARLKINHAISQMRLGKYRNATIVLMNCETARLKRHKYLWLFISMLPGSMLLFLYRTKRWLSEFSIKVRKNL